MNKYAINTKSSYALSNGELLVKNLRLLDLDEEFDWPQICSNTFAASDSVKNLSRRSYCAAWILYKLFELFEPAETKAVCCHKEGYGLTDLKRIWGISFLLWNLSNLHLLGELLLND
jgi:hypothetical protein